MPRKADIGDYKKITHADFEKIQFRVGTIVDIKVHSKNKNDYILLLDCAAADEDVQVVASLKDSYGIADLLGKQVIVICNIQPEMVGGEESQGMLLIAHKGKKKVLIGPHDKVPPGATVSGIIDGECRHFGEREH
jgi:methionine--tRNA ligase beta chain